MSDNNPIEEFFREVEARETNRSQLLSYWCDLYPDLVYSPKELYALVAKNLEALRVPGLESDYVMMRESGAFSSERLYFQLRRERLVFEVCGAPFGTGFFVSSRLFDRRRDANWFHVGLVVCTGILVLAGCAILVGTKFGWVWGVIAFTGAIAIIWSLLRLAATETLTWLDRMLSDLPISGLVYDRFFHPDTYYRQDTNNAYCKAVNNAVRRSIDEMKHQKGLKPLRDEEWRPVMRDLQRK
jgi:hypothetical protein